MNSDDLPFRGLVFAMALAVAQGVTAQVVPFHARASAPTVDGDNADGGDVPATIVPPHKTKPHIVVQARSATIRGGTCGDRVFLFVDWEDDSEDILNKPWVWNDELNRCTTCWATAWATSCSVR